MSRPSLALAPLLAACASAPPPDRPPADFAPFHALDLGAFPGANGVLSGFAPPDGDRALRVGDAALLGVAIAAGGVVDHLLLLLETTDLGFVEQQRDGATVRTRPSYTAKMTVTTVNERREVEKTEVHEATLHSVVVTLTRYDADGRAQQTSQAALFEEALAAGFWPDTDAAATPSERVYAGTLTRTLQGLFGEDDVLQDLMMRVVDTPSLWSIATNLGVSVVLVNRADPRRPRSVALAHASTAARQLPFEIWVNDGVALWADLIIAKPEGATMVCGGLLGAVARRPTDPSCTAVVRLLATRRGPRTAP